jgi:hypothetical protein
MSHRRDWTFSEKRTMWKRLMDLLFHTGEKVDPLHFAGRLLLLTVLAVMSVGFLKSSIESNYVGHSFMHLVNLPFHEAGHVVFRPFGRIMHSLGGSLGQIIMPLVCMLVLLLRTRDNFGASVALWWCGESVLDIAPYIQDARYMNLPLLGGNTGSSAPYGFHDWNFILSELNLMDHYRGIASFAQFSGKMIMVLAFIWGLAVLARQFIRLRSSR